MISADILWYMSTNYHTSSLHTFDSGARILNVHVPNYPISTSSAWLNAGSWTDPLGKEGLSHLAEHLIGIKTSRHPDRLKRIEIVENNGLVYNASTTIQSQHYFFIHNQNTSKLALELLIDGLANSLISQEDVENEKVIITSEESQNFNDLSSYIWRLANKGLWGEKSLGKDFYGSKQSVRSISIKDVDNFYTSNFIPSNILFVCINSALSLEEQKALIESGGLGKHSSSSSTLLPLHKTKLLFEQRPVSTVELSLSFQTVTADKTKDRVVQNFISTYWSGFWTSKLTQRLRLENKFTYWISADSAHLQASGYLRFGLSLAPENLLTTLKIFEEEISQLKSSAISGEALAVCKTKMLAQIQRNSINYGWLMDWYGYQCLLKNDILTIDDYCRMINDLTAADIQSFAQTYLLDENFALAYIAKQELLNDIPVFDT